MTREHLAKPPYKPLPGQLDLPLSRGVQHYLGELDAEPRADEVTAEEIDLAIDAERSILPGPRISITGASSSHPRPGGLDWLGVSAQLRWNSDFADLRGKLLAAQAARRDGNDGSCKLPGGYTVSVLPTGRMYGATWCEVVFEWESMQIGLENRQIPNGDHCNAFILVTGEACLVHDAIPAFGMACTLLAACGAEVGRCVPSRTDACVDLPGVTVDEFVERFLSQAVIARAKKKEFHVDGRSWTGLEIGLGGDLCCRIYDKAVECTDERKRALLIQRRWGGVDQEHAARVEFEIKRDPLRERWNVASVDDLVARLPQIVEWLTTDWLRFTEETVDAKNKNQSRAVTSAAWCAVQEKFADVFGLAGTWFYPPLPPCPSPQRLLDQAWGCFVSAVARAYNDVETIQQLWAVAIDQIGERKAALLDKLADKRRDYAHRSALHHLGGIPIPD